MNKLAQKADIVETPHYEDATTEQILVIGDLARWRAQGRLTSSIERCNFARYADLSSDMLLRIAPELILSPIVSADFDVIEVAGWLQEMKFTGRYRAITEEMPNTDMVRAEVRSQAPDLDFDLLIMPEIANDG